MSVRRVPKPWGEEIIYAHTERYAGKILMIRGGESLSLQYHQRKDESIYLLRGLLRPAPETAIEVYAIGQEVNNVRNNGPSLLDPLTEPAGAPLS